MKNHKQLLADFYLELLAIQQPKLHMLGLMVFVRQALCIELQEDVEIVERIFKRMAAEDAKTI